MVECRKAFLDLRTDGDHGGDERQTEVSDDGAAQQAAAVVVAVDVRRHVDGHVGRPRHVTEAVPGQRETCCPLMVGAIDAAA